MSDVKMYTGSKTLEDIAGLPSIDMALAAMVGYSGLIPAIHAIEAKKKIYLVNKETLVIAGESILQLTQQHHVPVPPVGDEHSATFQSLVGEDANEAEKVPLICSGGPFRTLTHEQLKYVTTVDALKHPTWDISAKVTIDSASSMNKGSEMVEIEWLFGMPADKIQVLIHPQSIVHNVIQPCGGGMRAQLGVPDIQLSIQYTFSFPQRLPLRGGRLDFSRQPLEFFGSDVEKLKCLIITYEAINKSGNMPRIVDAINEIANKDFRKGACSFSAVGNIIEKAM